MTLENIISKIKEQLKDGIYPGASLALYQAGRWQEFYFGLADPQEGKATQVGLVYDLASVSKVVGVGTLAAFLYEQGKLELDLPLQHYYPAFHREDVTLRQLLTHTSGLDPFIPNRDQEIFGQALDQIFQSQIFQPWGLTETGFGPVPGAVPTVRGVQDGQVHDPKARVLGIHSGSAGLFSSLRDLEIFLEHYLQDDSAANLTQNFSKEPGKRRSLAWNLEGSWLDHTGYTGTFIMYNRKEQKAAIFLSNRTYEKDERAQWILDRNQLMDLIRKEL